MKRWTFILAALAISACASYDGRALKLGTDTLESVLQTMGVPAMRWQDADGSVQLSYPRGPSSPDSFMVRIDKNGKLQSIRNVLVPEVIAQIKAGMSKEQVLRLIGPPDPGRTVYFKARDELAWDWRYDDRGDDLAYFTVLFDATSGTVRSTMVMRHLKPGVPI